MNGLRVSFLILCACLPALVCYAGVPGVEPDSPFSFGGYVKYLVDVTFPDEGGTDVNQLVHQRFNLEYRLTPELALAAGLRNRLFSGDNLDFHDFDKAISHDPGYWDLSGNWLDRGDALGNSSLDRLYFDWKPGDSQLRFGRHRIGWGMAVLWNPNDLFNSYSMFDFDYEERPGTDALLIGQDLGFASRAEIVWALGDNWDATSLAGRYQFNVDGYDIQLLAGKNNVNRVLGAGFSGSIYGAGLRGEVSRFDPVKSRWQGLQQQSSTVATLDTDYSFAGGRNLICRAALLYIDNPIEPTNALFYLNRPLTAKSLSFTRWTGYAELSFDATDLSRQSLGFSAYDDGSLYIIANNSTSLADDWELLLVWQHFGGSGDSLFGAEPADLLSARLRWSF